MAKAPANKQPSLVTRIDTCSDQTNAVAAIVGEDAFISAGENKWLRVWVKRDNGQYWPSTLQYCEDTVSALDYKVIEDGDAHQVVVGLGNGQILVFRLSKDLDRMERTRTYTCHSQRVTGLKIVSEQNWLLSCSKDKTFRWSCSKTGESLGRHELVSWCTTVEYDKHNQYVFVGDNSGKITVLKLEKGNLKFVNTLRGHASSVRSLCYDSERRMLFSGGSDQVIVVWDIGTQQGIAYELVGHSGKIRGLAYSTRSRKLISVAEDNLLGVWDMDKEREESAEWGGSNTCEKCSAPFFWNVIKMWQKKAVGVRQHHCRKCGRAVCAACSDCMSTYPKMGFEKPVRMCRDCHFSLTTADRAPMAMFTDVRSTVTCISLLQTQRVMVTASQDKKMRVWNVDRMLS